ncbi:UV DNA damage repair endonuclease UvsE [Clostridium felsineum]|uniref:UV DNA damage endonuclease n=1 Tax=Clostridium felsineum TaxID=36839 RepID=A0A1S8L356_9CLOT|nr:UV DNA damage repair endonuclease UvsE [Clostridium felsineum]URZ07511.1 UV DNA damage endonuclease [Clostridium felsineum]URZ12542.1 UV DNA damage endonuclease [Clostridium felsineum]
MSIGYACITLGVKNTKLSSCTLKNASEENLRKIIDINLDALTNIIDYNIKNDIRLFRISSDIIPFGSHKINTLNWKEEFKDKLLSIGEKIKVSNMRVSMHPGQYTVLNSMNDQVVKNAVMDLEYHTSFLDALKVDSNNKIILHIGGVYGDKKKASETFIRNYSKLADNIKKRLIIENDDRSYTIEDVLNISKEASIPVVFDNLHNKLNPSFENLSENQWINLAKKTWKKEDGNQKIHYSQHKEGGTFGAHSDTIFFHEFLEFYNNLEDKNIDIMLEVKDKNLSAVKCINLTKNTLEIKNLEQEWARYKYFTLSRSQKLYNSIRELLKDKTSAPVKEFYSLIEKAIVLKEDKGAEINAIEHVWGYVNKNCSDAEKRRYQKLFKEFYEGTGKISTLKKHILKCAIEQNKEYLIDSLYFYI